ncbi:MAG: porphobilinogen synthase [Thaumarchaeota archaeon]|nr:porphobilinogen synthase [Nitrososphaerota archaeon]
MSYPHVRLRRLRQSGKMRELLEEVRLSPKDLVCPVFVQEGATSRVKGESMPGFERLPIGEVVSEVGAIADLGIPAVMVFGIPSHKDDAGSSAYARDGIVQRAILEIRKGLGQKVAVMSDVCLCQYTSSGHCGLVRGDRIDNDSSLEVLARVAVSQAEAGTDVVSPSAMMDGQVRAIRQALDDAGFKDVAIMSHSAKHRSSLYSPFKDMAHSAPKFGDRKTYQLPYTNPKEAMREVETDIAEGVDIVMIKPALAYLDLIAMARSRFNIPIAAYSVSGEYALVKAAAMNGWIDEGEVTLEILTAIKRAGADMIVTYFSKIAAEALGRR